MKPFWITIGAVLTITIVVIIAGELIKASQKNAITPEVEAQTETLGTCTNTTLCTFDIQTLQNLYNDRSKLIYYQNETEE